MDYILQTQVQQWSMIMSSEGSRLQMLQQTRPACTEFIRVDPEQRPSAQTPLEAPLQQTALMQAVLRPETASLFMESRHKAPEL